MKETPYISAVFSNDHAHIKTLREEGLAGTLTRERIKEIEQEALLWLKHLYAMHRGEEQENGKKTN